MDPMEEFTFKPLTEGLGFHKKKKETGDKKAAEDKNFLGASSGKPIIRSEPLAFKSKAEGAMALKSPLPKKEMLSSSTVESPSKEVIDELVKSFKKSKEVAAAEGTAIPQVIINPVRPQVDEAAFPLPWMMSPFLIDAMLVLALILSALMVLLLVTKIDLLMMMVQNSSDVELWLTFPAIGLGMVFTYMSLSRILLGSSLGEMIFDVQLGTEEQQSRLSYSFLVMGRTFLSIVTGMVPLPLMSLALRKDYLGLLSGLRLFPRKK